jgi:hypothetical protein
MIAAKIEAVMIPRSKGCKWAEARNGKRFSGSPPGRASGFK